MQVATQYQNRLSYEQWLYTLYNITCGNELTGTCAAFMDPFNTVEVYSQHEWNVEKKSESPLIQYINVCFLSIPLLAL